MDSNFRFRPTVPVSRAYNPGYAHVQNEHVWQTAWADIMQHGRRPQDAADEAFKRVEEIFAKYPISRTWEISAKDPTGNW
jgi:ABC-type glycerol-3-phosphate transport system substrate-binding protein